MVSHPETGSDSPIGSDRDRGRDTLALGIRLLCKKQETKRIEGGLTVASPMPKSVLP